METQAQTTSSTPRRKPWNKGKLIGQKHQREKGDGHETGDAGCSRRAIVPRGDQLWGCRKRTTTQCPGSGQARNLRRI